MGAFTLAELTMTYVQFLVLLTSIEPSPYPDFFTNPLIVFRLVNLDFSTALEGVRDPYQNDAVRRNIPVSLPLDLRFEFLLIALLVPFFISSIFNFFLANKTFNIWYFVSIISIMLIVTGSHSDVLREPLVDKSLPHRFFVASGALGIILLLVCLGYAVFVLFTQVIRRTHDGTYFTELQPPIPTTAKWTVEAIMQRQLDEEEDDYIGQSQRLFYILGATFASLACFGAVTVPPFPFLGALGVTSYVLGGCFAVVAVGGLVWFFVSFTRSGREMLWRRAVSATNLLLAASLLTISVLVVPVESNLLRIFDCVEVSCPAHHRLPDPSSSTVRYSSAGTNSYATTTNFSAFLARQNVSAHGVADYCQPMDRRHFDAAVTSCPAAAFVSQHRLAADKTVQCSAELRAYFGAAGGVVLVVFFLGSRVMQFFLTEEATEEIRHNFPLDMRQSLGLTQQQEIEEKMYLSDNVGSILYGPFRECWSQWNNFRDVHRFFVVFACVVVFTRTAIASSQVINMALAVTFHVIFLVALIAIRPYARAIENYFAISTQTLVTVVAIVGLATAGTGDGSAPDSAIWVYIIVAILVVIVPIACLVAGYIVTGAEEEAYLAARAERVKVAIADVVDDEVDAQLAGDNYVLQVQEEQTDDNTNNNENNNNNNVNVPVSRESSGGIARPRRPSMLVTSDVLRRPSCSGRSDARRVEFSTLNLSSSSFRSGRRNSVAAVHFLTPSAEAVGVDSRGDEENEQQQQRNQNLEQPQHAPAKATLSQRHRAPGGKRPSVRILRPPAFAIVGISDEKAARRPRGVSLFHHISNVLSSAPASSPNGEEEEEDETIRRQAREAANRISGSFEPEGGGLDDSSGVLVGPPPVFGGTIVFAHRQRRPSSLFGSDDNGRPEQRDYSVVIEDIEEDFDTGEDENDEQENSQSSGSVGRGYSDGLDLSMFLPPVRRGKRSGAMKRGAHAAPGDDTHKARRDFLGKRLPPELRRARSARVAGGASTPQELGEEDDGNDDASVRSDDPHVLGADDFASSSLEHVERETRRQSVAAEKRRRNRRMSSGSSSSHSLIAAAPEVNFISESIGRANNLTWRFNMSASASASSLLENSQLAAGGGASAGAFGRRTSSLSLLDIQSPRATDSEITNNNMANSVSSLSASNNQFGRRRQRRQSKFTAFTSSPVVSIAEGIRHEISGDGININAGGGGHDEDSDALPAPVISITAASVRNPLSASHNQSETNQLTGIAGDGEFFVSSFSGLAPDPSASFSPRLRVSFLGAAATTSSAARSMFAGVPSDEDPLRSVAEPRRSFWRRRSQTAARVLAFQYATTPVFAAILETTTRAKMLKRPDDHHQSPGRRSWDLSSRAGVRRENSIGDEAEAERMKMRARNLWFFSINQVVDELLMMKIDDLIEREESGFFDDEDNESDDGNAQESQGENQQQQQQQEQQQEEHQDEEEEDEAERIEFIQFEKRLSYVHHPHQPATRKSSPPSAAPSAVAAGGGAVAAPPQAIMSVRELIRSDMEHLRFGESAIGIEMSDVQGGGGDEEEENDNRAAIENQNESENVNQPLPAADGDALIRDASSIRPDDARGGRASRNHDETHLPREQQGDAPPLQRQRSGVAAVQFQQQAKNLWESDHHVLVATPSFVAKSTRWTRALLGMVAREHSIELGFGAGAALRSASELRDASDLSDGNINNQLSSSSPRSASAAAGGGAGGRGSNVTFLEEGGGPSGVVAAAQPGSPARRGKKRSKAQQRKIQELLAIQKALSQPLLTEADQELLKSRVHAVYQEHLDGIGERQRATDYRINRSAMMHLQVFFALLGIFAFIAIAVTAIGLELSQRAERIAFLPPSGISNSTNEFHYAFLAKPLDGAELQLAGYLSWSSFTAACCCVAFENQTDTGALVVEKWLCGSGNVVKERVRATVQVGTRALENVRGLCDVGFKNGCHVAVETGAPHYVSLEGCAASVTQGERDLW